MVAITPITNYPQTTSLNGSETVPGVQAGTTVKIPISQIGNFARTFTPGGQTFAVVTITAAYAVQATDQVILATTAAGVPTFPTAPDCSALKARQAQYKKVATPNSN